MDNGPEFTSKAVDAWAHAEEVKLHFIRPGKPTENAYVESYNGRFREECLNENSFRNLLDARTTIDITFPASGTPPVAPPPAPLPP